MKNKYEHHILALKSLCHFPWYSKNLLERQMIPWRQYNGLFLKLIAGFPVLLAELLAHLRDSLMTTRIVSVCISKSDRVTIAKFPNQGINVKEDCEY